MQNNFSAIKLLYDSNVRLFSLAPRNFSFFSFQLQFGINSLFLFLIELSIVIDFPTIYFFMLIKGKAISFPLPSTIALVERATAILDAILKRSHQEM